MICGSDLYMQVKKAEAEAKSRKTEDPSSDDNNQEK